ncbi:single-stranded DNA-binding protein [Helcococcus kunzii]|uniref:single-stranded DNA-binding protein n=1 Tax=Helcococcus kunzii TaxID=40091 RepID=UPI0024ACB0E0|nr:single-stranded DNA-binding protein [Helcococcus kunzii]
MNNVVLMGRLTRDCDLRFIQGSNQAVCRFTLAVDKNLSREKKQEMESKNQPTADFINIVAWGKLGENVAKYTGKGLRVLVAGRIQTGSYEKDGQRIYTTDVQVINIEFLDWKDSNSSQENFDNSSSFQSGNNSSIGDFPTVDENFDYSADFDPTEDRRIPF